MKKLQYERRAIYVVSCPETGRSVILRRKPRTGETLNAVGYGDIIDSAGSEEFNEGNDDYILVRGKL